MWNCEIAKEVCQDLIIELGISKGNDHVLLEAKVKNAVREVRNHRNYPSHFTEDDIQKDLSKFYSNIHDLALYDYNQVGVEGQVSHSEMASQEHGRTGKNVLKGVFAWAGF